VPAKKPAPRQPVRKAQTVEQKASRTAKKEPAPAKKPAPTKKPVRSQGLGKAQTGDEKAGRTAEKEPAPAKKPARSQGVKKAPAARRK
jgi:hypothetical protein